MKIQTSFYIISVCCYFQAWMVIFNLGMFILTPTHHWVFLACATMSAGFLAIGIIDMKRLEDSNELD